MKLTGNLFVKLDFACPAIPAVHLVSHVFDFCIEYLVKKRNTDDPVMPTLVLDMAVSEVIVYVGLNSRQAGFRIEELSIGAKLLSDYFVKYRDAHTVFHCCQGGAVLFAYPLYTAMLRDSYGREERTDYGRELFDAARLLSGWSTLIDSVCRICMET